jgi:moderate conductance mechanosensitive channel
VQKTRFDDEVAYGGNLREVFDTLQEAGEQTSAGNAEVLDPTRVEGVTSVGETALIIRTITRVKPGRQDAVAAQLRLAIKEGFDPICA